MLTPEEKAAFAARLIPKKKPEAPKAEAPKAEVVRYPEGMELALAKGVRTRAGELVNRAWLERQRSAGWRPIIGSASCAEQYRPTFVEKLEEARMDAVAEERAARRAADPVGLGLYERNL
jgi:hypothetical protein